MRRDWYDGSMKELEFGQVMQIVTAAIAVVAVVVGPFFSYRVARRQIRASVVSSNRQVWIDNLRGTIADFLAKYAMVRMTNLLPPTDTSLQTRIEDVMRSARKIELFINPREQDHAELVKIIAEMTNSMNRSDGTFKDVDVNTRRVVELSQTILKREWDRVKRGD